MIRKIFENKLFYVLFCIIVFILFFAVAIKGYYLLSKIAPVVATISGVTGISAVFIIEIFFQLKKDKNKYVNIYKILCWVIIAAMISGFCTGKYYIKTDLVTSEAMGTNNEAEEMENESEINIDEDFYPVASPEKLEMDIDSEIPNNGKGIYKNGSDDRLRDLVKSLDGTNIIYAEKINSKEKIELKIQIESLLKSKIGTGNQPTDEEVNGNRKFTDKVDEANELQEKLDEMVMDVNLLMEIINLREEAYNIYKTTSLRKLLANDYTKLGKYYYQTKDISSANKSLLTSALYECAYLQMEQSDNYDYYKHIYKIGMIYHLIGDLESVDEEYRTRAYILSACLLEIAASNISLETNEKFFFFSTYYAGMVNHKLVILFGLERECDMFIDGALANYCKSIQAKNYKKQQNQQYAYVIQISSIGKEYIRKFGEKTDLLNRSELDQINNEYQQLLKGY